MQLIFKKFNLFRKYIISIFIIMLFFQKFILNFVNFLYYFFIILFIGSILLIIIFPFYKILITLQSFVLCYDQCSYHFNLLNLLNLKIFKI